MEEKKFLKKKFMAEYVYFNRSRNSIAVLRND